jgi:hypothetical protein
MKKYVFPLIGLIFLVKSVSRSSLLLILLLRKRTFKSSTAQGFLKVSTSPKNTRRCEALLFAPWQSLYDYTGLHL